MRLLLVSLYPKPGCLLRPPVQTLASSGSGTGKYRKKGHYEALGLTPSATSKEIKDAFFSLSKKFHPDVNPDATGSLAKFQAAAEAYEVLGDASMKKEYDVSIGVGQSHVRRDPFRPPPSDDEPVFRPKVVQVDLSEKSMKTAWQLYRERWKAEEKRLEELDELKLVFRTELDAKRRAYDSMSEEEREAFKEGIRQFKHPDQWSSLRSKTVIVPDAEVKKAEEEKLPAFKRFLRKLDFKVEYPEEKDAKDSGDSGFDSYGIATGSGRKRAFTPIHTEKKPPRREQPFDREKRPCGTPSFDHEDDEDEERETKPTNDPEQRSQERKEDNDNFDRGKGSTADDGNKKKRVDFDPEEYLKFTEIPNIPPRDEVSNVEMFSVAREVNKFRKAKENEVQRRRETAERRQQEKKEERRRQHEEDMRYVVPEDPMKEFASDNDASRQRFFTDTKESFKMLRQRWRETDTFQDGGAQSEARGYRYRTYVGISRSIVLVIFASLVAVTLGVQYIFYAGNEDTRRRVEELRKKPEPK